ncbi:MAG: UPF0175 family protein [Bacteroidota bacterium]
MGFEISDDILASANMSEEEFRIELGIYLYTKDILSLGKASEFTGLPKMIFQQKLAEREISVSYDLEEFEKDLSVIKEKFPEFDNRK